MDPEGADAGLGSPSSRPDIHCRFLAAGWADPGCCRRALERRTDEPRHDGGDRPGGTDTADLAVHSAPDRQTRPESNRDADRNDTTSCWLNRWRLKQKLQWKPYALRHAYAGRLWRNGGSELSVFDAAQLMGHSQKEHIETYRKWIDPNKIAVSALAAIKRNQAKVKEDLAQTLQKA